MADYGDLWAELRVFLSRGPTSGTEAAAHLGVSQPVFSRLVAFARRDLLIIGRARATRYLARRHLLDQASNLPIYEVAEDGGSRKLAVLHAVLPRAYYVEALAPEIEGGFFPELPYFLDDLRPSGFLGRLVPRRHPELGFPTDVQLWTADQVLAYVGRHGWNGPGNLIVGDEAFRRHLEHAAAPPDHIPSAERAARYPQLAEDVMNWGVPGSSAAGEQPKFLVSTGRDGRAALVKFSPPIRDATSRRLADLLVAEHLALTVLADAGQAAARTTILKAGERVFLESERFDRLPGGGRRGLMSLLPLDAEHIGRGVSWSDSAVELRAQGRIDEATLLQIRWRELYGRLIANIDMHPANLSFFTRGTRILGLAPAYDMSPALYAPVGGHVREPTFQPPAPDPADGRIWDAACKAATRFWNALTFDGRVSPEFRALATANVELVGRARELGRLLPPA